MLVTLSWIEENYNKYNNLYWDGKLPKISFKISRSKQTWGYASYKYNYRLNTITPLALTLSNYYDSPENVKLTTLLHEMIHIADYVFNPHHFVYNHKKVNTYDAHGYDFFIPETVRLSKYGWHIMQYVTDAEKTASKLSQHSKELKKNKEDIALVCVIYGVNGGSWMIKTNTWHVKELLFSIRHCEWSGLNGIKDIKFYSFTSPSLASKRSCGKSIRGWFYSNSNILENKLKTIKATENINYNKDIYNIVMKLVA